MYIGPCRCGFGPNAFYVTPIGTIAHAWETLGLVPYLGAPYAAPHPPTLTSAQEIGLLERQKRWLEDQLRRIVSRLEELRGE